MALFQWEEQVKTMSTICFCFSLASFLQLTIAWSVQGKVTSKKVGKKKKTNQAVATAPASLSCGWLCGFTPCVGLKLQLSPRVTQTPAPDENRWGWENSLRGKKNNKTKAKCMLWSNNTEFYPALFPAKSSGLPFFSSWCPLHPAALVLW